MIGDPTWFQRRKYGGWGIHPRTWQGWTYLICVTIPFILFHALPFWSATTRIYVTLGWLIFLLADVSHIMISLHRDERERKIEALAERNAAWFMVAVLTTGILYEIIQSAIRQSFSLNLFLATALIGGATVKGISNLYYEHGSQ
jgi:hypothetical protein